jgi:hypothetical protein
MTTLFGYSVEQDFDLALEQRRDRLGWLIFGGTALCILYSFTGRPFDTELFQGWIATSLFYGDNFYVRRWKDLARLWLWKSILITIPIHALYLAGIFWLDWAIPQLMTKVAIFLPVIALGFATESITMQPLIDRFKPSGAGQIEGQVGGR